MSKQGSIKHYRQTGASPAPQSLPYGEIAISKSGILYVGNENNIPVGTYGMYGANLLDNSNFLNPVNQRGNASYTGNGYGIDRWFHGVSTVVSTITPQGIKLSGGDAKYSASIHQYTETPIDGSTYTFSVCTAAGNIYVLTGIPSTTSIVSITPFGGMDMGCDETNKHIRVSLSVNFGTSETFRWAKLEKGNVATPYVPKSYGAELNECRRFYQYVYYAMRLSANVNGITFNPPMRIAPTIKYTQYGGSAYPTASYISQYGCVLSISGNGDYANGRLVAVADY